MSSCSDSPDCYRGKTKDFCLKDTVHQAHRDMDFIICFVILINLNAMLLFVLRLTILFGQPLTDI